MRSKWQSAKVLDLSNGSQVGENLGICFSHWILALLGILSQGSEFAMKEQYDSNQGPMNNTPASIAGVHKEIAPVMASRNFCTVFLATSLSEKIMKVICTSCGRRKVNCICCCSAKSQEKI
jgi:hypothetical protein